MEKWELLSNDEIVELFEKLATEVKGHAFTYTEWDTGVTKCTHPEHQGWYSSSCWKARTNEMIKKWVEEKE